MKKLIYLIVVIVALALIVAGCGLLTAPPAEESELDTKKPSNCATIQDGTIYAKDGVTLIETGYDEFGYNYQAHMFNGRYCDYDRVLGGDYCDDSLIMKWNDAWMSNKDCNSDDRLDRHFGYDTYIGSGAWLTNHQTGFYDEDIIVDEVNIGLESNEVGHNLDGWSDPWDWGGNYGNAAGLEYSFRLLMGPGDGCGPGFEEASFTMNTYGAEAHKLILRHLDGSQDDNFDVYIWDGIGWELIDSYASQGGGENWVTTEFTFSPRSGELKFKLVATGEVTGFCSQWGQVAFSYAELEGTCYWDYFCKIVAAPLDAVFKDLGTPYTDPWGYQIDEAWYAADGTEIGPVIWGAFAIIQEVYNDPCAGISGVQYHSPAGPGLGKWEY